MVKTLGEFVGLNVKKGETFEAIVAGFSKSDFNSKIYTNMKPQTILIEVTSDKVVLEPHDVENKQSTCKEFVFYKTGRKSKPQTISNLNNLYKVFVFDGIDTATKHYKLEVEKAIENLNERKSKISPEQFEKQLTKLENLIK